MEFKTPLNEAHNEVRKAEKLLKNRNFDEAVELQDKIVQLLEGKRSFISWNISVNFPYIARGFTWCHRFEDQGKSPGPDRIPQEAERSDPSEASQLGGVLSASGKSSDQNVEHQCWRFDGWWSPGILCYEADRHDTS